MGTILMAGCGSTTKTVTQTVAETSSAPVTTETTSSTASTQATSSAHTCATLVASTSQGVGTCENAAGNTVKYASPGHHLFLSGLTAQWVATHTAGAVGGGESSSTAKAHGTFVIITLRLTNRETAPQEYKNEQASLLIGGNTYTEAFDAENGPDQQSFIWKSSSKIQPQEAQTGDVIFDVPSAARQSLASEGGAVTLKDFGEEESKESYGGLLLIPKA